MTKLGGLLCFVGLVLGCVLLPSNADKFRAILKAVRYCKVPPLPTEFQVLKISYSNRGNFFHVDALVAIYKKIKFTKAMINVYRGGGVQRVKYFGISYPNVCKRITEGHPYSDPLFSSGCLSRSCELDPKNYTCHVDYDLHGDVTGGMLIRGQFVVEIKTFDDDELVSCMDLYVDAKKDTLN